MRRRRREVVGGEDLLNVVLGIIFVSDKKEVGWKEVVI